MASACSAARARRVRTPECRPCGRRSLVRHAFEEPLWAAARLCRRQRGGSRSAEASRAGFVYSVGMPASVAAASAKALEIMNREPEGWRCSRKIRSVHARAKVKGLDTGEAWGYGIIPVIVGETFDAGSGGKAAGSGLQRLPHPATRRAGKIRPPALLHQRDAHAGADRCRGGCGGGHPG